MKIHRTIVLAVLATAAFAPAAGAVTPAPTLEVKGAYAYVDTLPSHQKLLKVVFRTRHALSRRFDGLIRAGVRIENVGHSVGTAKSGTNCYTASAEIRNGVVPAQTADHDVVRKPAKLGRTFSFVIEDATAMVPRKLKLRAERPGDDKGKPLGC